MKFTYKDFMEKAIIAHGGKYNYDKVVFINTTTRVIITCPIHGEFSQTPFKHYTTSGCPHCGAIKSGASRSNKPTAKRSTQEQFLQRVQNIHGNTYTYEKTKYITASHKVTVTCKQHGDFTITASKHIQGQGCRKCAIDIHAKKAIKSFQDFKKEADIKHNYVYTYNESTYIKGDVYTTITCNTHGEFKQTPTSHLMGRGCPKCANAKQGFRPENFAGKQAIFYVLKLKNGLYKPGITTQSSVKKRYNQDNFDAIVEKIIFEHIFEDGKNARLFEIEVLNYYKNFKYEGEQVFPKCKNTEIITVSPMEYINASLQT